MRIPSRTLALALVSGGLVACAPEGGGDAGPAVDIAAEAQAIRDLSMQWLEAAQAKDAAAIATVFAADGTTIFDGELHQGRANIQAEEEQGFSENPDGTTSWVPGVVEVAASGDLAFERGGWTFDADGPGEGEEVHGEYVTVWQKIDGRWQVAVDAGTTLTPDDDEGDDHEDDEDADDHDDADDDGG